MSEPQRTSSAGPSIGEVAHRTGIPIETLRFYDRSGLLGDLPRTAGGHRVFDEVALGLLDVVVRLRRTGMPVEDVRAFVERVRADRDRAGRIELLQAHRERVRGHLEQLRTDLAVIDWKIASYTANEAGRPGPPPPPGWPAAADALPAPERFDTDLTDSNGA
ncbi:MAG TPA: MerR family transcriptional regulator [Microlunatus sp.]|nr:MerR family transcriptional regulator [Microlunatus sp.]